MLDRYETFFRNVCFGNEEIRFFTKHARISVLREHQNNFKKCARISVFFFLEHIKKLEFLCKVGQDFYFKRI